MGNAEADSCKRPTCRQQFDSGIESSIDSAFKLGKFNKNYYSNNIHMGEKINEFR